MNEPKLQAIDSSKRRTFGGIMYPDENVYDVLNHILKLSEKSNGDFYMNIEQIRQYVLCQMRLRKSIERGEK